MQFIVKRRSRLNQLLDRIPVLGRVLQRPLGALGFVFVLALVLTAIFAPLLAPYDPIKQDIPHLLNPPSREHLIGTDYLGRDLLSRLIYGSRIAVEAAIPSISIALFFGLILGLAAGYLGGRVELAILILMDTINAFPGLVLALAIMALLGPSLRNVILIIGFAFIPGYARVTRAQVLSVKESDYVQAELNLGASPLRIVLVHILPNVISSVMILVAMDVPVVITFESALSFLGLGVQPPDPSWGVILSDGFRVIYNSPWPIIGAGLALALTTLGFSLFGETLRDVLDPRLSGVEVG